MGKNVLWECVTKLTYTTQKRPSETLHFQSFSGHGASRYLLCFIEIRLEWYVNMCTTFSRIDYYVLGNPTYAAISAVATANFVLVLYIISSVMEDRQERTRSTQAQTETRKQR